MTQQMSDREPATDPAHAPLDALAELARSAGEDPLPLVLRAVALTVLHTGGFATVVLNVFRPAWDDYEAIIVEGHQDGVDALLGSTVPRESFERLLASAQTRFESVSFLAAETTDWGGIEAVVVPTIAPSDDLDAWDPEDAVLVTLTGSDGEPLGVISIDEPRSGRRPMDADLRLLHTICSFAERALSSAQRADEVETDGRLLRRLTQASPELTRCASSEALYALTARVITDDLGFERVAIYRSEDEAGTRRRVLLRGFAGTDPPPRSVAHATLAHATEDVSPRGDCWLLAEPQTPAILRTAGARSRRNGRGPRAWSEHCLLIPWTAGGDRQSGFVLVEDPVDCLLPSEARCRSLRLLVDLAASIETGIRQRQTLSRLASHDVLTGLRNRRGLDELIDRQDGVAVLLCDLDHFKSVNDRFGHEVGDRVLEAFGHLLREHAREHDCPVRLGGEEFCLVLPQTGRRGALVVAERLRAATAQRLSDLVPGGVTVSIGIAVDNAENPAGLPLLTLADRALYQAKHAGRNRAAMFA